MLVDKVWEIWDRGRKEGRSAEFVDLSDPDLGDPIQAEAWKLVPQEMRDYIRQKFGDNGFMVRREMINNTMGYRAASGCSYSEFGSLRQALVQCLDCHWNLALTPAD